MTAAVRRFAKLLFPRSLRQGLRYRFDPGYRQLQRMERDKQTGRIVFAMTGGVVCGGPFAGLRFADSEAGFTLGPKLLGTYEKELYGIVQKIFQNQYDTIVNIGAGDGFYAVVGTADQNSAGLFLNNGPFTTLIVDNLGGGHAIQASTEGSVGIYSSAIGSSIEGSGFGSTAIWGDTGAAAASGFSAVLGSADDNYAGFFLNCGLDAPALVAENDFANRSAIVFQTFANFGNCGIDVSGNLSCSGAVTGVVSADGGARKVALYAMQSPENWFEDAGSGQLANGFVRVELDPTFAQTVNAAAGYHVFLTPKGDSEGLYVTNDTPQGFEVHEQRGGHSNIAFDYRIMAKRLGYENLRLADVTEQFKKQEAQRKIARRPAQPVAAARPGEAKLTPPVGSTAPPISVQSHQPALLMKTSRAPSHWCEVGCKSR